MFLPDWNYKMNVNAKSIEKGLECDFHHNRRNKATVVRIMRSPVATIPSNRLLGEIQDNRG